MPEFPTKESEIVALVDQMIAGRVAHPMDFPHLGGPGLSFRRRDYIEARDAQTQAYGAAQLATENKHAALKALEEIMKRRLKQAEVDVAGDPVKLAYIGWGPKAVGQAEPLPGQPVELKALLQRRDHIRLEWKRPASGGAVANYIIQSRDIAMAGQQWKLVGLSYNTNLLVADPPSGVKLEYRVIAANATGQSPPSNIVTIAL
jgi:hypothetical protein